MTPTERALRLSVAMTEREQEMYEALKDVTGLLADFSDEWSGHAAAARASKKMSRVVDYLNAILARIEAEAAQPASAPSPTTLGA